MGGASTRTPSYWRKSEGALDGRRSHPHPSPLAGEGGASSRRCSHPQPSPQKGEGGGGWKAPLPALPHPPPTGGRGEGLWVGIVPFRTPPSRGWEVIKLRF